MSLFQRTTISFLFVFAYMWACVHVHVCVGTYRGQKSTANYLDLKLKVILSHSTQVPGTEYRFSGRTTSAIDSFLQPQNASWSFLHPPKCLLILTLTLFFKQITCFHASAKASLSITWTLPRALWSVPVLHSSPFPWHLFFVAVFLVVSVPNPCPLFFFFTHGVHSRVACQQEYPASFLPSGS